MAKSPQLDTTGSEANPGRCGSDVFTAGCGHEENGLKEATQHCTGPSSSARQDNPWVSQTPEPQRGQKNRLLSGLWTLAVRSPLSCL